MDCRLAWVGSWGLFIIWACQARLTLCRFASPCNYPRGWLSVPVVVLVVVVVVMVMVVVVVATMTEGGDCPADAAPCFQDLMQLWEVQARMACLLPLRRLLHYIRHRGVIFIPPPAALLTSATAELSPVSAAVRIGLCLLQLEVTQRDGVPSLLPVASLVASITMELAGPASTALNRTESFTHADIAKKVGGIDHRGN